jgi:hypothetical protein
MCFGSGRTAFRQNIGDRAGCPPACRQRIMNVASDEAGPPGRPLMSWHNPRRPGNNSRRPHAEIGGAAEEMPKEPVRVAPVRA